MLIKELFEKYKILALYSGGSILKAFVQMLGSLVIAKFVAPEDLGLWTTINLALIYSGFLQAGLINGINLELPYALGKSEKETADSISGTAQIFVIGYAIVILTISILFVLFYTEPNLKIKYGVLGIGVIIILTLYHSYLSSTFRSYNLFHKLSYLQIFDALFSIITILFVVYFSYFGIILKLLFSSLFAVSLLHYYRPMKTRLKWNSAVFKTLVKSGLPIFALAYAESICLTADRLWILKYSDMNDLGIYSFAFYAFVSFSMLTASIATYVYPKMTYNYGKYNDKVKLWVIAKKLTIMMSLLLIPLAAIAYFIIPVMVLDYFPKYASGVSTMQILVISGAIKGISVGSNVLWSIKSWREMIIIKVSSSLLFVGITFFGIQTLSNKIEGIAVGVLVANVLNTIISLYATYLKTSRIELD